MLRTETGGQGTSRSLRWRKGRDAGDDEIRVDDQNGVRMDVMRNHAASDMHRRCALLKSCSSSTG